MESQILFQVICTLSGIFFGISIACLAVVFFVMKALNDE